MLCTGAASTLSVVEHLLPHILEGQPARTSAKQLMECMGLETMKSEEEAEVLVEQVGGVTAHISLSHLLKFGTRSTQKRLKNKGCSWCHSVPHVL